VDAPVYIPKVFDGRNKLFWMLSLEGLRERNPGAQVTTIPQPEQLQGDFSKLFNSSGALVSIYDPKSTALGVGGRYLRTPYAGNRIPSNLVNPIASKVASYYPAPPDRARGWTTWQTMSRSSHRRTVTTPGSERWTITFRKRASFPGATPRRLGLTSPDCVGHQPAEPSGEAPSTRVSRNWGADWTYTLNPSMVFNLRFGLARYEGFGGNVYARVSTPSSWVFRPAWCRNSQPFSSRDLMSGRLFAVGRKHCNELRDPRQLEPTAKPQPDHGPALPQVRRGIPALQPEPVAARRGQRSLQFQQAWTQQDACVVMRCPETSLPASCWATRVAAL